MIKTFVAGAGLAAVWLLVVNPPAAEAQRPSIAGQRRAVLPYQRPVTSPYLNLLDPSRGSFELRYFRDVRPELEFRSANALQFQSLDRLEERVERQDERIGEIRRTIGPTGHSTSFLSFGNYFNVQGAR
ncbi:MAG: hypothetical protein ACREQV_15575 [Candidatus Binatia bacterium]